MKQFNMNEMTPEIPVGFVSCFFVSSLERGDGGVGIYFSTSFQAAMFFQM